jgi:hypothetical protein
VNQGGGGSVWDALDAIAGVVEIVVQIVVALIHALH